MRSSLVFLLTLASLGAQVPEQSFFMSAPAVVSRACAERALALKPKHLEVLIAQGRVELTLGDERKAKEWFTRAERLDPEDAEVHRVIAQAWLAAGRRDEVLASARKALELASRDSGDLADFAVVLSDGGFADMARALIEQAVKVNPTRVGNLVNYGAACLRAGNPQEGILWLDRAFAINPLRPGNSRDVAEAYAENARRADLPAVREKMLAAAEVGFATDSGRLLTYAKEELEAGRRDTAARFFWRAALADPKDPSVWSAAALAYAGLLSKPGESKSEPAPAPLGAPPPPTASTSGQP